MTQEASSVTADSSIEKPRRVLIVDDDLLIRAILKDIITKLPGYECVGEASDGEEAVRKSLELSPDVMFLDIVMPKKNGIAAAHEISEQANPPKIIICTSMTGDEVVEDAHAAGISAYLKKPATPEGVSEALQKIFC